MTPTRKRGAVVAAVVAVALLVGTAVVVIRNNGSGPSASSTTTSIPRTTTTTSTPSIASTTDSTSSSTTAGTSTSTSASADLAPFVAAAGRADTRLKAAAAAVNGRIAGEELRVDQATANAVRSARAAVDAAGRAVPAGLEPGLLRAALLVQSDLVSRALALNPAWSAGTVALSEARPCLRNGSAAAARYGADLAALRGAAAAAPPVVVAAPTSRAAEELAVRLGEIDIRNSGCDSCGGYIATELPPITFYGSPLSDPATGTRWDGTIGDLQFRADAGTGGRWTVLFNAC